MDAKSAAPHEQQAPSIGELRRIAPEAQLEDHTCGLLMLRAIYKAYGMDPDKANLRFRLGVDVPANPLDPESMGTMQPDILRVITQDGFDYAPLVLPSPDAVQVLTRCLRAKSMAAALIRRRQNGHMHWVALQYDSDESVKVMDSLAAEPYSEPVEAFVNDCLLSCILLSPGNAKRTSGKMDAAIRQAEFDGVADLAQTVERYLALRQRAERGELPGGAPK